MSPSTSSSLMQPLHSNAWVVQTWVSWVVAVATTAVGIWCLPVDSWIKAFLGMGVLFTVGSTFSLAKTVRDVHEQQRIVSRIDDARMTRLLAEVDPLSNKG